MARSGKEGKVGRRSYMKNGKKKEELLRRENQENWKEK